MTAVRETAASQAFDPNDWSRQFLANMDRADRNAMADSGWSKTVADECDSRSCQLLLQLLWELQEVEIKPADFFDRPQLAAILAAVHALRGRPIAQAEAR